MADENADTPNVRIIPPLVYIIGLAVGFLVTLWMPFRLISDSVAWPIGGVLLACGIALAASAILNFKEVGTTVRPDRAASTLVTAGPYRITRNPMYLGLAFVYPWHCASRSIGLGHHSAAARLDCNTALRRWPRRSLFEAALRCRLRRLHDESSTLDLNSERSGVRSVIRRFRDEAEIRAGPITESRLLVYG